MYQRHYFNASNPEGPTACGGKSYGFGAVSDRFDTEHPVTCKRCLASLAKRDLEFRAKARRQLRVGLVRVQSRCAETGYQLIVGRSNWADSARAIAREEGWAR